LLGKSTATASVLQQFKKIFHIAELIKFLHYISKLQIYNKAGKKANLRNKKKIICVYTSEQKK
jgi:hypothetical protein